MQEEEAPGEEVPEGQAEVAAEAAVAALYAAINAGEAEGGLEMLAAGVRWHRPPDVPITGTVEGAEKVAKMWRAFTENVTGFEIEPSRLEVSGDKVLAPITMRGTGKDGKSPFEFGGVQVFRVADGEIAEVWEFRSLPEARELLS
jgi:ketosteroid isomerase-like protein